MIAVALTLGLCVAGNAGCYDYPTRTIILDPHRVTPYVLAHEVGHGVYFDQLTSAQRGELVIGDPAVREEEAWADVYAACVLERGPRWLRTAGYGVRVGMQRFQRICRTIERTTT